MPRQNQGHLHRQHASPPQPEPEPQTQIDMEEMVEEEDIDSSEGGGEEEAEGLQEAEEEPEIADEEAEAILAAGRSTHPSFTTATNLPFFILYNINTNELSPAKEDPKLTAPLSLLSHSKRIPIPLLPARNLPTRFLDRQHSQTRLWRPRLAVPLRHPFLAIGRSPTALPEHPFLQMRVDR